MINNKENNKNPKKLKGIPINQDHVSRWYLMMTDLGTILTEAFLPEVGRFKHKEIQKVVAEEEVYSKDVIFDFYCENENAMVDLEMQNVPDKDMRFRAMEYLHELGNLMRNKGKKYSQRKKTYVLFYLFHGFRYPDQLEDRIFPLEFEKEFGMQIIFINGQYDNPADKRDTALTVRDMTHIMKGEYDQCREEMQNVVDYSKEVAGMDIKPWQKADERKEKQLLKKQREDTIRFMANSTGVTDGAIAEYLSVPVSEVPAIRAKYRNK